MVKKFRKIAKSIANKRQEMKKQKNLKRWLKLKAYEILTGLWWTVLSALPLESAVEQSLVNKKSSDHMFTILGFASADSYMWSETFLV